MTTTVLNESVELSLFCSIELQKFKAVCQDSFVSVFVPNNKRIFLKRLMYTTIDVDRFDQDCVLLKVVLL